MFKKFIKWLAKLFGSSNVTFGGMEAKVCFEETIEESPEVKLIFQDPEAVKSMLKTFSYGKEQIDEESLYVWYVTAAGRSSEDSAFKIVKENGDWKILMIKGTRYEPVFSKIIEEAK